ncbi:MAG: hypothetical protein R6W71_02005 [Bacteroidales bacterium]
MLTIRKDQVRVFEEQKLKAFIDEMVKHISEFSPEQFEIIKEPDVRKIISLGIQTAESYGFTLRGPLQFYLEMMFMLGSDFDTDPQYMWIREMLMDKSEKDQMKRADLLYDKVIDFLDQMMGEDYEYEIGALKKFVMIPFSDFQEFNNESPAEYVLKIKELFPEKVNLIDEQSFYQLHEHSSSLSRKLSISVDGGIAISFSLMFIFGHGCFTDLQYPWIKNTIHGSAGISAAEINHRLYSKMMIFFEKALNNLQK